MVAYLENIDGNAEFHEIIDFLTRSSIHYALTVSLVVSTTFVEQFWMTAKSKTINNVRYITAIVAGKPVSISEASIRSDLQFNDAAGIDPDPSLRPSSSNPIPDSILEGSGGNHGGHNSKCLHEEKIGKEEVLDETLMYRRTKDAQDEGRTSSKTLELSLSGDTMVLEEKESKEKEAATSRKPASIGRIQKNLFCSSTSRFSFRKRLQADNTIAPSCLSVDTSFDSYRISKVSYQELFDVGSRRIFHLSHVNH
ncbi:hypothetical protein Tco_1112900 [Tanacetum coccineum]|uniref:Uncharacterized protein n=1 Tax=Tanacetum coccineum TaxID=301880 RepID=A0ABQ5IQL8_9ASTR